MNATTCGLSNGGMLVRQWVVTGFSRWLIDQRSGATSNSCSSRQGLSRRITFFRVLHPAWTGVETQNAQLAIYTGISLGRMEAVSLEAETLRIADLFRDIRAGLQT